jgi:hypothetical protein
MSVLSREVRLTQNPALGATLQWRFACGYVASHPTAAHTPLPLLFLVVPIILHQASLAFIASTQRASGLRACVAKFSDNAVVQQDVLLAIHERVRHWRDLSLESLRIALSTHLLHLNLDGSVLPLSETPPSAGIPPSVRKLHRESEKLGFWCGQLTIHEISNLLRVRF